MESQPVNLTSIYPVYFKFFRKKFPVFEKNLNSERINKKGPFNTCVMNGPFLFGFIPLTIISEGEHALNSNTGSGQLYKVLQQEFPGSPTVPELKLSVSHLIYPDVTGLLLHPVS